MSQKNTPTSVPKFQPDGRPGMKKVVPLGLQYVLAMFAGNIAPMILVTSAASLPVQDVNMLLQRCMPGAAVSAIIQLYPIRAGGIQIDSGLPCMVGLTYVFLPAYLSTAGSRGISYIFGAQVMTGAIAVSHETLLEKMSSFFPPVVTGIIVMTAGTSIFNLAIGDIADDMSSPDFGAPINWTVGIFVMLVMLGFNILGEGLPKAAATLISMITGYTLSVVLGLVSFSGIEEIARFAFPEPFAFGIKSDLGYTLMFVLLYFTAAVQMIGSFNVSCMGRLSREPTPDEIGNGATTNRTTSIISTALNSFPAATYSQSSGTVVLTKVCSRFMILVDHGTLFLAGLYPKIGAMLSTIPNCMAGSGTVVVFTIIAASGMKLLAKAGYSNRNCLIIGVSLAFGLGTQFCEGTSAQFPAGIATMLEENNIILMSLLTIVLDLVFPKDPVQAKEPTGKVR